MIEIKENLLRESLRECKELRKTTNFEKLPTNPWHNHDYEVAKLIDIDFTNGVAEVQKDNKKLTLLIKLSESTIESLQEIGDYYGITAFISNNYLCDISYITVDMLTLKGVDA